eukprot:12030430-Ditylum_brightwellii.AAC.1
MNNCIAEYAYSYLCGMPGKSHKPSNFYPPTMSKSFNNKSISITDDDRVPVKPPASPVNIMDRTPSKLDIDDPIDKEVKLSRSANLDKSNKGSRESYKSCFSVTSNPGLAKANKN